MADDRTLADAPTDHSLGARLRAVRIEVYGPDGVDLVAEALGIPPQVWRNIEHIGELITEDQLSMFLVLTGASPIWLLRGEGPKYRSGYGPSENGPRR